MSGGGIWERLGVGVGFGGGIRSGGRIWERLGVGVGCGRD